MIRVLSVVGARPQFVKAAVVSKALSQWRGRDGSRFEERLVHTGQHYDRNMSGVFFEELGLPPPAVNLGVGSGSHGLQTGRMLAGLEREIQRFQPDWVLVYGDTNSTLAGVLVAAKLHIRVAHVEAGLRSFNRRMPEEINRVVADQLSDLLLCPSKVGRDNLVREGVRGRIEIVGDVMLDCLRIFGPKSRRPSFPRARRLRPRKFVLATIHRSETTDDPARLRSVFDALDKVAHSETVVVPLHPRTRKCLRQIHWKSNSAALVLANPVSYLEMIWLEKSARVIVTDSGGVQKEAFYLRVPCVTVRSETEWVETVRSGWNRIAGTSVSGIVHAVSTRSQLRRGRADIYGTGRGAPQVARILAAFDRK